MSELRVETWTIPTAPVRASDPLPPLFTGTDAHQVSDPGDADEEMLRGIGYGRVRSTMPYLTQNDYGRERVDTDHRVAVLENDTLRAVFLLGVGGRLWSLVHKPTDRELLFVNPVLQPANLALRNAWSAGGVEWNVGTIGHSTTTYEPLHAVRVEHPDGTPALRLYELERMREVVFQVDAWLPPDSPVLLVHVRIVNPNDTTVPMYWWSNIAVPQAPEVRVLAPADAAWQFTYVGGVRRVEVPVRERDGDRSYPSRATTAADYFFEIEGDERRWIAALDATGCGLAQTSTDLLRGRKLFMWGKSAGGDHWQEWLSGPGSEYLEIQAGLARTQLEHLPMPARSTWSWVEAYGLASCDAAAVHGSDWRSARSAAARGVERLVSRATLDEALLDATAWADLEPTEILRHGSGWGALERHARTRTGEAWSLTGTPFPDETLGPEQQPWLDLLDGAARLAGPVDRPPRSYQRADRWLALLAGVDGWEAALHRGVIRAAGGDLDGAADDWRSSLAQRPSAWAHRNLGALARSRGDLSTALGHYAEAVTLAEGVLSLTVEHLDTLLAAGRAPEARDALRGLPARVREHGRVLLVEARASLATGDLERAGALLDRPLVVADVREAETTLHELWFDYQAALRDAGDAEATAETPAVPRDLDFRMFERRSQ